MQFSFLPPVENCSIPASTPTQSVLMRESLWQRYCVLLAGSLTCQQNTMIAAGFYSHLLWLHEKNTNRVVVLKLINCSTTSLPINSILPVHLWPTLLILNYNNHKLQGSLCLWIVSFVQKESCLFVLKMYQSVLVKYLIDVLLLMPWFKTLHSFKLNDCLQKYLYTVNVVPSCRDKSIEWNILL